MSSQDEEDLLLDSLQKVVTELIDEAIPSVLTTLEVSNRQDAAITIKKLAVPFLFGLSLREYEHDRGIQCEKFRAGIQSSVLSDKSDCSIKSILSFHIPPKNGLINLIEDFSESTDWSDDRIWREFLSRVVVQFWQHYKNRLTFEECRN